MSSEVAILKLLKQAKIIGFIAGCKLIGGYDKSDDALNDWQEFKAAVDKIKRA